MKDLLIIGARGWGREVFFSFKNNIKDIHIKGFLDDNIRALDGLNGEYPPIISSVEDYQIQPNDVFFCAVGNPVYRKKYAEIIEEKGGKFISFISPLAIVNPTAVLGEGVYIGGNSIISDNVIIGKHAMIHALCTLGHDVRIGDYVSIEAYSFFGGFSEIGNMTEIHVRSTILNHRKVGRNVSVGAGSVVLRNIKDDCHVFGVPAKII